jgi:hypothetical protein
MLTGPRNSAAPSARCTVAQQPFQCQLSSKSTAGAFARRGGVYARDGFAGIQRHRSVVVAGRCRATVGVDSSRPGEGEKSDSGTAQCGSRGADLETTGQTPDACVQLSREANYAGQHQGLVRGAAALGHRGLSLARSAVHLGGWHVQQGTPLFALQELGAADYRAPSTIANLRSLTLVPVAPVMCGLTRRSTRTPGRRRRLASFVSSRSI